ncbi:hypothetical protein A3768_1042 [Ralstonia solanacearum]|nr:hypothetical protein F504_2462 [Ralstonia pseudosolanacearum FQY_4]ANH32211.1 hypothetical protein A3768_1042 [Ralstonia solanacearum]
MRCLSQAKKPMDDVGFFVCVQHVRPPVGASSAVSWSQRTKRSAIA